MTLERTRVVMLPTDTETSARRVFEKWANYILDLELKSKHQPTWDDVETAIDMAREISYSGIGESDTYTKLEIIEHLKQSKL